MCVCARVFPQVAEALHDIGMPTSPPDRLLQDLKAASASVKENMCAHSDESFETNRGASDYLDLQPTEQFGGVRSRLSQSVRESMKNV